MQSKEWHTYLHVQYVKEHIYQMEGNLVNYKTIITTAINNLIAYNETNESRNFYFVLYVNLNQCAF